MERHFSKHLCFYLFEQKHGNLIFNQLVIDWSVKVFALHCRYGEIESIRVLHERFCAFVNFKNANMAARAMEKLNVSTCLVPLSEYCVCFLKNIVMDLDVCCLSQGYCIENTRLVVRYPDRRTQRVLPIPLKTCLPVTQQAGAAAG